MFNLNWGDKLKGAQRDFLENEAYKKSLDELHIDIIFSILEGNYNSTLSNKFVKTWNFKHNRITVGSHSALKILPNCINVKNDLINFGYAIEVYDHSSANDIMLKGNEYHLLSNERFQFLFEKFVNDILEKEYEFILQNIKLEILRENTLTYSLIDLFYGLFTNLGFNTDLLEHIILIKSLRDRFSNILTRENIKHDIIGEDLVIDLK